MNRRGLVQAVSRSANVTYTPVLTDDGQVFTELIEDRNATVARVWLDTLNGRITATGSSKRHPGEAFDQYVGRRLALGRALQRLGENLVDSANARVKENERED